MTDIRIKDLTSAAGQLDEFDKFEFIVDVSSAEASMKVSGKEIKGVMAPKQHIHDIADVSGLIGELEKKLDKKGGAITGDLSVMGDTYLRRLHLEEFLEVPEYRYNRVDLYADCQTGRGRSRHAPRERPLHGHFSECCNRQYNR